MEEFFLCTFFSNDKLDIIDEKYIIIPVFVPEFGDSGFISGCFPHLQSFDQFIGKCLAGYIKYLFLWILVQDEVCNGMHQMGLSKTDASI